MIEKAERRFSVRKRYIASSPITPQWVKGFIKHITTSKSPWIPFDTFNGSYNLRSYFYGTEVRVETPEEWISYILQNFSDVSESYARFKSDGRELSLRCDHRRSLIDLEVSGPSVEISNNELTEMEKNLNLIEVQENPYRYRKSAATYKVGDWNRKVFVDATRDLLMEHFKGQEPAVNEAFVTKVLDDNIERLQGFHDVKTYLSFIEESEESSFEMANLAVEGANGLAIGISLSKKDKRLEFRSNVPPNEFEEKIVKPYKEPLQLKSTKGESTGSAISVTNQPKTERWWVKYAFQVIIAIIGTAAIMVTLARAYLTEYDLEITNPIKSPAEVNSPEVSLDWYLWPKDSFFHGPDYQASASILIIHNGVIVDTFENVSPPFAVHLENGEGEYIAEIQPQRKAQPVRVVITYKTQPTDTGQSPP